ncbi:hypothetical protein A7U60_g4104 [Sanghuangporus baumii]|uniref:Uncharacterized protein n=1 Tax=Sanghuangporus baumii TaxID=108892 RepID=A0A9Q5HZ73_SANBA|nr:hypothetical protein A7U60_g4104 [Sanghuangporus baumii]
MAAMETKKRKREAGPPRVMFITSARTFERLLKESSLRALKFTVGKKLGLVSKTTVELCQIRDGKTIDLEDEDDFDAFKSYAVSNGVAEVKVIVSSPVATSGPPVRAERSDARQNDQNFSTGKVPIVQMLAFTYHSKASDLASNNQAQFNSEIQTNEDSGPRGTVLKATDEMSRSGSKHIEKRTPPSVRPVNSSSADTSKHGVTSVSGKKSHPQSKLASSSLDTEKSTKHTAELATVLNEVGASGSSSAPQESAEASKPGESGKDKGDGKKSGKEGGVQTNAVEATLAHINDVEPPIASPAPSPTLPRPEVEVAAPQPPKEVKKPRAKKPKTSTVAEIVDKGNQKQSNAGLPSASLPGEETVHDEQSEERQPDNTNDKSPSPARVEPKIKKRKRDIDDKAKGGGSADLETAGKTKKRKTASGAGDVKTVPHEGETSANSPVCSNSTRPSSSAEIGFESLSTAASVDAKSKPSKAKKKSKPTPEEESHYERALDNVIAEVLAKRVSASSRQIPSNEPVTTTVSSAASDQIDSERPLADSVGADEFPISNRRKKRKKRKVTGVSATTPSGEASENVSSKAIAELDSPNDSRSRTKSHQRPIEQTGFAHGALQKGRSDRTASPPERTIVQTVPVTRALVQTSSVTELRNASGSAIAIQSKIPTNQPKSGAKAASDSVELLKAAMKEAAPPTKDTRQPVALDSLLSTLSVAHDATRKRDDDSSSDSGSDSDSNSDGDAPSNPKEGAAGDTMSSLRDPISSFAIAGLTIDDSMDIDSLLKPKSNVSWRKVTMLENDGNEDEQELMSDVEEGESIEGRNHKNAPRNNLLVRYAPSSASTEEENEDEDEDIESNPVGSAQASNSMSEVGSFSGDSRSPTKTMATSQRPTGSREDNSIPSRSDVLATEPGTNTLPDKAQSQPSRPSPSFGDVNTRGESILTEHVANVAVDRADDTLFLTSIGKPNQQIHSAKPSVTGKFGITHDQLASARLMNETADEHEDDSLGRGTSVSETSKESEERNPSLAFVPPSKATKAVSQGESKVNGTIPHPPSLQSIAFSQNSTVSSSGRGASGVVKRMKDRYGRNADANVSIYSNLSFTESTPVKERRHPRTFQLSQPIVTEESDTPHTAATQASTQEKSTLFAGDSRKAPLPKRPAGATAAVEKPGTEAETAARSSLQKALSQPPQTATAPMPAAIQTLHVDRSRSSQDMGNQQKTGSQPSPMHVKSASTESGSTTDVKHSEAGQKRPSRNSSPYIPVKDARPTARPRSLVASETEEDSGSDGSDKAPLLQQVQNHASRPSIVGLRSLHNIASRRELFSPASTPRPSFALSPATRFSSQTPAEVLDDNDSDDDDFSSTSSDSDSNNQSNIPKDKRAGNAPSHRKRELWI